MLEQMFTEIVNNRSGSYLISISCVTTIDYGKVKTEHVANLEHR